MQHLKSSFETLYAYWPIYGVGDYNKNPNKDSTTNNVKTWVILVSPQNYIFVPHENLVAEVLL